jgi:hypothetical protein
MTTRIRLAPIGLILALAAGALMAFTFTGASTARSRSCAPHGVDLLAKAGAARVYRDSTLNVYGCRPGVRRKLGPFDDPELLSACNGTLIDRLRATPHYVAWRSNTMCHNDPPRWAVHVLRISRRAPIRSYPTGNACQTDCTARSGIGPALRIALNPQGGLAWSALDVSSSTVHPIIEVSMTTAAGAVQLARGVDINPDSVRWLAGRVTWMQGGTRRTS